MAAKVNQCPVDGCSTPLAPSGEHGHLRLKGVNGDDAHMRKYNELYGDGGDPEASDDSADTGNEVVEIVDDDNDDAEDDDAWRELNAADALEKQLLDEGYTEINVVTDAHGNIDMGKTEVR